MEGMLGNPFLCECKPYVYNKIEKLLKKKKKKREEDGLSAMGFLYQEF
jgi:hypothetical protein